MSKSPFNIQSIPKKYKHLGVDCGKKDQSAIVVVDYAAAEAHVLAVMHNTGKMPPMPVSFTTTKPSGAFKPTFLGSIGVPPDLIAKMHAKPVKCISGPSGVRFEYFPESDHKPGSTYFTGPSKVVAKLPIELALVNAAKNGHLDDVTKAQLCSVMIQTIEDILEDKVQKPISGTLALLKAGAAKTMDTPPGGAALKHDAPLKVSVGLQDKVTEPDVFPTNLIADAPTIKLRDATKLYQPTDGTSAGSRYYVIAISDDLRMSCRYQTSGSLSLRVEGPNFTSHLKNLEALGIDTKAAKGYASVHLKAETPEIARKIVGAMIMGLGVKITSPLPDLGLIANK